jgi:hypothetical protein
MVERVTSDPSIFLSLFLVIHSYAAMTHDYTIRHMYIILGVITLTLL